MTLKAERDNITACVNEAVKRGARKEQACKIIGLTSRTIQRWEKKPEGDQRPEFKRYSSKALTDKEKDKIIEICNSSKYKDMTPNEIVPILAEKGEYYASESTFYRILRERKLLTYRSDSKPPNSTNKPDELKATGPNQVWSWDITYLKTKVKGIYYYLYLFMDVWSRLIVGWTVEEYEDGEIAAKKIKNICREKGIKKIYLHSDNGGPMKCGTMLATLQGLGIVPSFSRPHVSNDNPFSESLFKTLKYVPSFPKEFKSLEETKSWVAKFVKWYNEEHRHSSIKFVSPMQRHNHKDVSILQKRKETYIAARKNRPDRWSGDIRNWDRIEEVYLNKKIEERKIEKAA